MYKTILGIADLGIIAMHMCKNVGSMTQYYHNHVKY